MKKIILLIIMLILTSIVVHAVKYEITGTSMEPLLYEHDIVYVTKAVDNYGIGDIVTFKVNNSLSICHAIIDIDNEWYTTYGINNPWWAEESVHESRMIGKVYAVRRDGRIKTIESLIEGLYE